MKLTKEIIVIFTLVLSFTSCNDFFEDEIQYVSQDIVIESGIRSRGIIDDIYTDYSFNYFTDFSIEYLTDNGVVNSQETALATSHWGAADNPYEFIWQQSYNNIRQVYQYIELVHNTGIPFYPDPNSSLENERIVSRYYGEAHFLKAWAEWQLLKIFGGPSESGEMLGFPIVNEILENEQYAELSRNTYEECVNQIIADLDVAIEYLPLKYSGADNTSNPEYSLIELGRASGIVAYALKAKLALYAASPAFNPTNDITKWEIAAQYTHDFIEQNGGLTSLQSYNYSSENNSDHIWRIRNSRQNNSLESRLYPPTLYGQGEVNPSQNLVDAFADASGYPITAAESTYDSANPYTGRDSRFYRFIFYNGDGCFSSENCTDFNPLEIFTGGKDNFGGFIKNEGTRTGYYLKKFLNNLDFDPSALNATTNLPKVYVQLDLADLYLIYAEAVNEAYGNPSAAPAGLNFSAKEVLSRIRQRAGVFIDPYLDDVSTNQADFRNFIKNERRIELCFSGDRFHDLRRWKDIITTEDIKGVQITKNTDDTFSYQNIDVEPRIYKEKNYYLPLPYNELLLNTNLIQNQGW